MFSKERVTLLREKDLKGWPIIDGEVISVEISPIKIEEKNTKTFISTILEKVAPDFISKLFAK